MLCSLDLKFMYAEIAYCMEVPQASSWDEDYNNATPLHDQDLC